MQNVHFITTQQYKKMYKKTHYFNTSYPKILTCNKKKYNQLTHKCCKFLDNSEQRGRKIVNTKTPNLD